MSSISSSASTKLSPTRHGGLCFYSGLKAAGLAMPCRITRINFV